MKKNLLMWLVLAIAVLTTGCDALNKVSNLEKDATQLYFEPLNNYFVNNTVECKKTQKLVINDQRNFEHYFGEAAVMGSNGEPTRINWNTQYVLAVVLPETNRSTLVEPIDVKLNGNAIIYNYHVTRGDRTTYNMVPFAAVALDKPANSVQMEVYFNEK